MKIFRMYIISDMWQIFLILYTSYLILGPHWESRLIEKKPLRIVDSVKEFFRRSIFISYVALLYTAWFLYTPSYKTLMNALMISGGATYGYHSRWGPETPFPMHVLLNIFLLIVGIEYLDVQTLFSFLLLITYHLTRDLLYISK